MNLPLNSRGMIKASPRAVAIHPSQLGALQCFSTEACMPPHLSLLAVRCRRVWGTTLHKLKSTQKAWLSHCHSAVTSQKGPLPRKRLGWVRICWFRLGETELLTVASMEGSRDGFFCMCSSTGQDTVTLYLSSLWQDKQSIQTMLFSLLGCSACEKKGCCYFPALPWGSGTKSWTPHGNVFPASPSQQLPKSSNLGGQLYKWPLP